MDCICATAGEERRRADVPSEGGVTNGVSHATWLTPVTSCGMKLGGGGTNKFRETNMEDLVDSTPWWKNNLRDSSNQLEFHRLELDPLEVSSDSSMCIISNSKNSVTGKCYLDD